VADSNLKSSYKGIKFKVTHCKGALDSFNEALKHVEARKRDSFQRSIILQIQRLADGERMSRENFPQEGELPKCPGKKKAKKYNALKRKPVRGYCWLSEKHPNTYFISHYVYKDYRNLKSKDTTKVGDNWNRIEVGDDEY